MSELIVKMKLVESFEFTDKQGNKHIFRLDGPSWKSFRCLKDEQGRELIVNNHFSQLDNIFSQLIGNDFEFKVIAAHPDLITTLAKD